MKAWIIAGVGALLGALSASAETLRLAVDILPPSLGNPYRTSLPPTVWTNAAMFDALGARRKLLVAHDWGAAIAWVVAMRRAVPLDGLIIMNVPHPTVFGELIAHYWPQRLKSWYVAFFQIPWLPEFLLRQRRAEAIANAFLNMAVNKAMFPPEVLEVYRQNALQPGALTAMINYYRANLGLLDEVAAQITVPTLMLWGEEDKALDLKLTENYGRHVRDFTLQRFPNVSHWVQQEAPDAVNAAMLAWLREKRLAPANIRL